MEGRKGKGVDLSRESDILKRSFSCKKEQSSSISIKERKKDRVSLGRAEKKTHDLTRASGVSLLRIRLEMAREGVLLKSLVCSERGKLRHLDRILEAWVVGKYPFVRINLHSKKEEPP